MNTAEMKKGATNHCSWVLCKSNSRYPERMPKETLLGLLKSEKLKMEWKSGKKIRKMSSQRKQKSECMHVAEKA